MGNALPGDLKKVLPGDVKKVLGVKKPHDHAGEARRVAAANAQARAQVEAEQRRIAAAEARVKAAEDALAEERRTGPAVGTCCVGTPTAAPAHAITCAGPHAAGARLPPSTGWTPPSAMCELCEQQQHARLCTLGRAAPN